MPRASFLYVFAYDVERDRTRAKIAALLENEMVRVQKSVFEGRMTRAQAGRLQHKVAHAMGPGDSLRVYAVTADGLDASLAIGSPLPEKSDYLLF